MYISSHYLSKTPVYRDLYAWRAYSNDGSGFAIGFKPDLFQVTTLDKKTNHPNGNEPIFFRTEVHYDPDGTLKNEIIEIANAAASDISAGNYTNEEAEMAMVLTLIPYLAAIKHNAFSDEHEHRLYHRSLTG
ncbi:MAG: hypothetical protein A3J38_00510 [Gammaproteobacteria bacterium RIFCSPHIGHO2_12_FULL_45_9]|nr:MAG: hypothetical protein A3J38_00510 [Gammaproteobacteria bacterium RIFCSPHIGHO2_12_FULL_45_9]